MPEYTLAEHTVVDIDEGRLGSVYPLVRTAVPGVSLEQWLAYASGLSGSGGVLGLCGPDRSLFGFVTYDVKPSLNYGRVLHVDHFVTFELRGAGAGRRALHDAVETLARARRCGAIELRTSHRGHAEDGKAAIWTGLGHTLEGAIFVKTFAPAGVLGSRRPVGPGARKEGSSVKARSGAVSTLAV